MPAYKAVPLITEAQVEAASSRHMTHDQCMASYPGLYECVALLLFSGELRPSISEADMCLTALAFYSEADRVVDYWVRRGGVSMTQVEKAANRPQTARVLIKDGEVSLLLFFRYSIILIARSRQMYVKRFEPERHSRTRAALSLINDALLTSVEPIPDIEFVIQTDDAVGSCRLGRFWRLC